MTLRIDRELKSAAETAAKAQGISLTELVQRSLRSYTTPVCPTCGRSSEPNVVAPGFSPALDHFIEKAKRVPFVILTVERGEPSVYWATSVYEPSEEPLANSGVVMVGIDVQGRTNHSIGIPRGLIVGWRLDRDGAWYQNYLVQGYRNGNLELARQLVQVPTGPRRGGR